MRVNRGGNRQLNRAIHTIAIAQLWHYPPAKTFVARKRAEGKTWREALRALKRHLARVVFRNPNSERSRPRHRIGLRGDRGGLLD